MSEAAEVKSGSSSVKTSLNAKGEQTFEVKVYDGSTQADLDTIAIVAVTTMAKLRTGQYPSA